MLIHLFAVHVFNRKTVIQRFMKA